MIPGMVDPGMTNVNTMEEKGGDPHMFYSHSAGVSGHDGRYTHGTFFSCFMIH